MNIIDAQSYRVLLIDDHPSVRQGLRFLLEAQGHQITAEAGNYTQTMELLDEGCFDIALLDLSLSSRSGLELIPSLEDAGIAVLIYSMHENKDIIERAFKAGALGFVTKREEPDTLFAAINTIARGQRFMSPYCTIAIEQEGSQNLQIIQVLSDRERQIFEFVGTGIGNTEIATQLEISPRTVDTYLSRIAHKLELENRRELRKFAIETIKSSSTNQVA
jgi:DNA-binding NarL/FixJ family response regulator